MDKNIIHNSSLYSCQYAVTITNFKRQDFLWKADGYSSDQDISGPGSQKLVMGPHLEPREFNSQDRFAIA
jgi:hypothetical protein